MTKKRPAPTQAKPTIAAPEPPATRAKAKSVPVKRNLTGLWVAAGVGIVAVIGGLFAVFMGNRPSIAPSANTTPKAARQMGPVTSCQRQPTFVNNLGFKQVSINTIEYTIKGMLLFDSSTGSDPKDPKTKSYQHPSWDDAGYMHAHMLDRNGNIFLAPAPRVDLLSNPPEKQNTLYRVDEKSGEMKAFLDLPAEEKPSQLNPYGLMGLSYDCDTNSLYVSSIAGATRTEELGRLYRIDLNTGKVVDQLDYLDALGVGVFNTAKGKRLYYGSARTSDIRSIALDDVGNFLGEPRFEFSLAGLDTSGNDKGRRVQFKTIAPNNPLFEMSVDGLKFNYNLVPPSSQSQRVTYRFQYDPARDTWKYVDNVKK